jgi:TatD DNase family protein
MEFIDTHAHLYADEFSNDLQEVIIRAKESGVNRVILPAIDSESHHKLIALAESDKDFFVPLMGLHPTSVNANYKKELSIIENYISQRSDFHGIGEIGIDLYWDKTFYKEQIDAFRFQLELAKQNQMPVVIHTRDSFAEVYEVMKPLTDSRLTGVFHCFGGDLEQAKKITDMGFSLGLGGVLTFKNSGLADVIQYVDLNHIVLETDSPYLAPVPNRGKRNESSFVLAIAQKLADTHQVTIEEIARVTTENAKKLFGI